MPVRTGISTRALPAAEQGPENPREDIMPNATMVYGDCDARFFRVRELFQASFDSGVEIGAGACFYLDGRCVVDIWGGHYDWERTREWERDTLVNVYSTTKGMTALCALQLMDRGLLDIDAPVADYWPEFAAAGKGHIPVRWLLSHKAGLCALREPLPQGSLCDWNRMCDALAAETPWWTPGQAHGRCAHCGYIRDTYRKQAADGRDSVGPECRSFRRVRSCGARSHHHARRSVPQSTPEQRCSEHSCMACR